MSSVISYLTASFSELKYNITWVTPKEAQRLTIVVVVFSILFSLAIWGIDSLLGGVVQQYFNLIS